MKTELKKTHAHVIVDGAFGVHVPHRFAILYKDSPTLRGVESEWMQILSKGIEESGFEQYWDAWLLVLLHAYFDDGERRLDIYEEDGDVFAATLNA